MGVIYLYLEFLQRSWKYFQKHLENSNMFKFPLCDFIHKNGPASIPFPSINAIYMIDLLDENFKIMYNAHFVKTTHSRSSVILFAVQVWDASEEIKIELIQVRCGSISKHETLDIFYASCAKISVLCVS
jgi:hypothetical protein